MATLTRKQRVARRNKALKTKHDRRPANQVAIETVAEDQDGDGIPDGPISAIAAYVKAHPDQLDAVIAAEKARDKPRKGVLELA